MVPRSQGKPHRFGGDWTDQKLDVVQRYLQSYTTALKNQPFRKLYIDAFAGTGYREARGSEVADNGQGLLFPDLAEEEPQRLLDGSARRALKSQPTFDEYHFIERSPSRCQQLDSLKTEFSELTDRISVQQGEANTVIRELCRQDWTRRRAVLFLDPYGMQVDWTTVEAAAKTHAIDLWLLFPLGIGVNRLLTRSGEIPATWRTRLNQFLGTEDWYEEFYRVESEPTLFEDASERVARASMEVIGRYFTERLASVFVGVAKEPAVLVNSRGTPLYLLCFAVGNPKGTEVALRIADHLLKGVR
jgi:three-Cys-motif partner protein